MRSKIGDFHEFYLRASGWAFMGPVPLRAPVAANRSQSPDLVRSTTASICLARPLLPSIHSLALALALALPAVRSRVPSSMPTALVSDVLSVAGKGATAFVGAALLVVALNVVQQLVLPRDPTKPPVVFHFVPVIGCAITYGMDPIGFLNRCRDQSVTCSNPLPLLGRSQYGPVFTFPLLGRKVTAALGPLGSNFVLNGKLAHVNAEQAYTHLTTPVFGTEVVYDVPNAVLMEQKKFVKFGLTTENFRQYVGLIRTEVLGYMNKEVFKASKVSMVRPIDAFSTSADAFTTSSEITILTASATLQGKEVRQSLDKSFAQLYHDLDGGFTPLNFVFPNLPLPSYRRRDVAQRKMREFYVAILEKRRNSAEAPDMDMLTALQNQEYKSGAPLTDKQIAHIMIALLMAGQHTSAATGAWAILRLGQHPGILKALWDEQVENHGDGKGGLKPLEYDTLLTPLLSAVIKEVLRLHPPIHSIMRKVIADCPVPSTLATPAGEPTASSSFKKVNEGREYVIPQGHFVLAAPGVSQVDESIWGTDANEFRPARWLEDAKVPGEEEEGEEDYGFGKISKGGKSAYLPFGAGRHRCIGEQFANVQLGTIIATLVREYSWTLDADFPTNDYTTMIVMPSKPRNVIFTPRA
ncbi:BQ5605_C051g12526 [Microbotryum silenes-dioicae]|uniref:BQ5605_C051g12526 protein n=1 Tax=Microbotryum silenes-dioicae TaxID=796604 RepID=A0A2X0MRK8_9BASI|nr:BQ5605_C051g12526 [Microbotryum silenes-dioicae]